MKTLAVPYPMGGLAVPCTCMAETTLPTCARCPVEVLADRGLAGTCSASVSSVPWTTWAESASCMRLGTRMGLFGKLWGKWYRSPQYVQGRCVGFPAVTWMGASRGEEAWWVKHSSHRSWCLLSQRRDRSAAVHARKLELYHSQQSTGKRELASQMMLW